MSLYQTNKSTLYNDTIYDHLFITQLAWFDNGCIFNSIENKCSKNQYQINDNKETPDSHSFMQFLAQHKRIGVG
jgi:hypothetical protein